MDIQKFVEEKKNEFKQKELEIALRKVYEGKSNEVTKEEAEFGLILLNCFPHLRPGYEPDQKEEPYWTYNDSVSEGDARFNKLKELNVAGDIWTKYQRVIDFFFDEKMTPFILEAIAMQPNLMYQVGWSRRSFRAPERTDMSFARQINFVIQLCTNHQYNFELHEYALYAYNIYYHNTNFTYVWAAALNQQDAQITALFHDIVYNRHETAKVNRSIVKAMLLSNREDAWEAVIKLLLSAQRQEGLRQTVLECLDETSLDAMKVMINVILEHKLARFSSVVRSIDVWAGFGWESERETTVRRFLELANEYLNNTDKIPEAIKSKDNAEVYMALWAQGVYNVDGCFALADEILEKAGLEKTALVLYFLSQVNLPEINIKYGLQYVTSDNLLVLSCAFHLLDNEALDLLDEAQKAVLFTQLEAQIEKTPVKIKTFEGKVFSWLNLSIVQETVYQKMVTLTNFDNTAEVDKILPYFNQMPVGQRERVVRGLLNDYYYDWSHREDKQNLTLTKYQRDFAFSILKDRGTSIRDTGLRALKSAEIDSEEVGVFADMLKRKSADLRKSVIEIILKQKEEVVKKTTGSLLKAKNQEQRLAGLDMLVNLKTSKTLDDTWITTQAQAFAENPKVTAKEEIILNTLISDASVALEYNAENGFGLYNLNGFEPVVTPTFPEKGEYIEKTKQNAFGLSQTPEKITEALEALKELYLANQNHEYSYENWDDTMTTGLLGNDFRGIKSDMSKMTNEEQFYNYPLADVWKKWATDYQLTPLDLFLINLMSGIHDEASGERRIKGLEKTEENIFKITFLSIIPKAGKHRWSNPINDILRIMPLAFPYEPQIDFLEGLCQAVFCNIAPEQVEVLIEQKGQWGSDWFTWRNIPRIDKIYKAYDDLTSNMNDAQFAAYWQLEKWYNYSTPQEHPNSDNYISSLENYSRAYKLKLINRDELMWRIMQSDAVNTLTQKMAKPEHYEIRRTYPFLVAMADEARNRILEIELRRGDSSTSVTRLAQNLQQIFGIQHFSDTLIGMGKDTLHRGYIYGWGRNDYNKKEILSTLLKRCHATKDDTQELFDEKVKTAKLKEKRLVEAATYAPQWLPFVAKNLNWKGMESAVWWLHAHTNAHHDAETEAEVGKYSKVALADFKDGAVDIDWFKEVYKALGKDRWKMLYASAKYISDGNGHKRATLYADVILGNTKITEVRKRVKEKRNQDYLRVYGLVPLSKKNKDADLLKRYLYLQQFKKESKQFGSQRQASEGLAVRIAMENLARTAGFSDPIRLTWAMETQEAKDILNNAEALSFDDVSIQLEVNEHGKSSLLIKRGDKELKAIPAKLKKEKPVVALKDFNKTLQNQYKRTRLSLEEAMVNGDVFNLSEIVTLTEHPVVAPMLHKLVLKSGDNLGFWQEGKLVTPEGDSAEPGATLQIAHCTDLYANKTWGAYQQYCFEQEIQQPFKQVFRELYVPTEDELSEKARSRRYAGHQVQPQKTVALLKTRGWTVNYEEGLQKTYHKEGFIARMYAMADWFTPADVESPTLETVEFTDRKTWKNVPFDKLDPRIFSEVMRDIDLVVSVAHVGDVDPEASQSTVELRAAIVRETVRLFKLKNVTVEGKHALIKGSKNDYSVHLGSAVAHKMPGVALAILPVHSQQRGRMFLPFLDEDPKTAEIMSKILLLAKEEEIQDPTILEQLV